MQGQTSTEPSTAPPNPPPSPRSTPLPSIHPPPRNLSNPLNPRIRLAIRCVVPHSYRNASTGRSPAARLAGYTPEISPTSRAKDAATTTAAGDTVVVSRPL